MISGSLAVIAADDVPPRLHDDPCASPFAGILLSDEQSVAQLGIPEFSPGDVVALTGPMEVDSGAALPDSADDWQSQIEALVPVHDWHAMWADDADGERWIVEPLIAEGRMTAVYSPPKVGKSLLMLEGAVAIARGTEFLGVQIDRPRCVLYIDFENDPRGDVRARLEDMGLGPDDLQNLRYASFPQLNDLDSPAGGMRLMAAVQHYGAEVVIIDTVGRSVGGKENENDTWNGFYRNTGMRLKAAGVQRSGWITPARTRARASAADQRSTATWMLSGS